MRRSRLPTLLFGRGERVQGAGDSQAEGIHKQTLGMTLFGAKRGTVMGGIEAAGEII